MSYKLQITTNSLSETQSFAENLAKVFPDNTIILLKGDIGSGKTTFSKYFINYLQVDPKDNVTSPTFNIVQKYKTKFGDLYHLDLYRIKDQHELFFLDIDNIFNHYTLIEWSENLGKFLPKEYIIIKIKYVDENKRIFFIKSTKKYNHLIQKLGL